MTNSVRHLSILVLLFSIAFQGNGQSHSEFIRKVFDEALNKGEAYENLRYLTKEIGARLSGSEGAAEAVEWSRDLMGEMGLDTVFLQSLKVPVWQRGAEEVGFMTNSKGTTVGLQVTALGGSIGTDGKMIKAQVVEIHDFTELPDQNVEGKIVFYNVPMDQKYPDTFDAYRQAAKYRGRGASMASKHGAIATITRSLASSTDQFPHTGGMRYDTAYIKIPAFALSTKDSDYLHDQLLADSGIELSLKSHCEILPDRISFNVVGEIRGNANSDEYLVVGGHIDSWDLGEGAHDDGAGCVQSIEVLRIFKALGYRPNRNIRAVMFMNEENGLRGGLKYAELAEKRAEKHLAAIESDRGGFVPVGFTLPQNQAKRELIKSWSSYFRPYNIFNFEKQGGGADIGPLAGQGTALLGLLPDSQRYFTLHHSSNDVFEQVNKRELHLGAGAMAALIYLIDQNGLD